MSDRAYRVEPTTGKCGHCSSENAPYFDVIGPDGFAQGTTFGDEVDAEEHANALNGAYEEGFASAKADLVEPLRKAIALLDSEAALLEAWAAESRAGGWSTHQADPQIRRADALRHEAVRLRAAITKSEAATPSEEIP